MNWGVFRTRALTALIFVAVMSAGLFTNLTLFFLLFSIIHFGCWHEYQKLMGMIYPEYAKISVFHRYGVSIAGWGGMLLATAGQWTIQGIDLASIGFWLLLMFAFIFPLAELLFTREMNSRNIRISMGGWIYLSLSFSLFIHLRSGALWGGTEHADFFQAAASTVGGFVVPILTIASIWINDTMAYVVGSFIGKTPLSEISPKKTWEGTIGGIILTIAIVTYYGSIKGEWLDHMIIASLAAIAGTCGDLFESKLKRMAGVKDSGHFMPGHGGFLDRFDSLLWAIPFVWLYVFFFMR